ncbi:meiotic recombination protein REC8 homolog isoform X2 [Hypanus sabinus]|uniref:meiotic recombination protein REC8 homolog isoform X2 n=1 Tax=Hypanus sabinus TaxID=79690 RepID=UPI0028C407B1|nr:meiotic recombination protein REC8 homolog isoform X2 [Hypanus sabinus]
MFYFPDVLQRTTGKFSTIWLVATKAGKVTRRDYLKVNVVRTCEEIIRYILVQVLPPYPNTSRPRFSLYLSAQLEIGVVRVFHRQCNYLIEEIQHTLERIDRMYSQVRINMPELEQPNLLLPDMATLMETYEGALDPFFGLMTSPPLPSPSLIPQVKPLLKPPVPEGPPEVLPKAEEPVPILTVSPELITIREVEPILMPEVEAGPDLPELSVRQLEDFLAEEFWFPEEPGAPETRKLRRRPRREVPREEEEVAPEVTEISAKRPEVSPVRLEYEEPSAGEAEVTGVPSEVYAVQPAEAAPEKEVEIPTPPMLPPLHKEESPRRREPLPSPELVLPEIYELPPVAPKRRRRRLQFIDTTIQIPREEMQEQIQRVDIHCVPFHPIKLSRQRKVSPASLFQNPAYEPWTAPALRQLWTRCARTKPVDYSARRRLEALEMEVLRETLEPSIPQLTLTGSLEESEPEASLIKSPEETRPPTAELEEKLPTVMEVSETVEVSPGGLPPPEVTAVTHRFVMDLVSRELIDRDETDLHTILPTTISRIDICRIFYICLVFASRQVLRLDQIQPYGRITITPGPQFGKDL